MRTISSSVFRMLRRKAGANYLYFIVVYFDGVSRMVLPYDLTDSFDGVNLLDVNDCAGDGIRVTACTKRIL
jgi:hypothetical protein